MKKMNKSRIKAKHGITARKQLLYKIMEYSGLFCCMAEPKINAEFKEVSVKLCSAHEEDSLRCANEAAKHRQKKKLVTLVNLLFSALIHLA